jgi:hypothetical protein
MKAPHNTLGNPKDNMMSLTLPDIVFDGFLPSPRAGKGVAGAH